MSVLTSYFMWCQSNANDDHTMDHTQSWNKPGDSYVLGRPMRNRSCYDTITILFIVVSHLLSVAGVFDRIFLHVFLGSCS